MKLRITIHKVVLLAMLATLTPPRGHAAYWAGHKSTRELTHDLDGDGIPDVVDPDIDNDGIPNALDDNIDGGIAKTGPFAGKYIGDHIKNDDPSEEDIDNDGLADDSLAEKDIDGDGKLDDDPAEKDIDGDGRPDDSPAERDIDGDGREDDSANEDDIDGDGFDDDDVLEHDVDGDEIDDAADDDIDGDGKLNDDSTELDSDGDGKQNDDPADTDEDGDGINDRLDNDDDNNGINDIDELNHHPEDGEAEVQSDLTRQPAAPSGSTARVTYQVLGTGSAKLALDVRDAAAGSYEFLVGGVVRGSVNVVQQSSKTRGTLVFKTADSGSGDLLLNFAVAGEAIVLRQGGIQYFVGVGPTPSTSTDTGGIGSSIVTLTRAPNVSNEAEAKATIVFGTSGAIELQIESAKMPLGDYTLMIGDAARGTVSLVTTPNGPRGTLVFKTVPGAGELPLNFAAAGQTIALTQGASTLFFGQLPAAFIP